MGRVAQKGAAMDERNAEKQGRRVWPRRVAIGIAALIMTAAAAFFIYTADCYRAGDTARQLAESLTASGELTETDGSIAIGDNDAGVGIVFYPGAKVEAEAYIPLACELAERGYYCVIAKMPFNLAFFGIDAANSIMGDAPEVESWWIAGHSLGGAMAAQFAAEHSSELEGVLLLAAYAASDLSATDLAVSIEYGSEDGVLNRDALEKNATNLPAGASTTVLDGGNHAGFGDYGPQAGDGEASMSAAEQWSQTADLAEEAIEATR